MTAQRHEEETVIKMLLAQGSLKEVDSGYEIDLANRDNWKMAVPSELVPYCPIAVHLWL